jgi:hypothetical protein
MTNETSTTQGRLKSALRLFIAKVIRRLSLHGRQSILEETRRKEPHHPPPSPLPLVPHFSATGHVAANWAMLEFLIDQVIWKLAGLDPEPGACLTAQFPSIHSRMRALIALLQLKGADKALIKEANIFVSDASPIAIHRNRIVHGPLFMTMIPK